MIHPFEHGQIISSPGCHFNYRVIGPCCRLFDREQLPWPCCRLQWRGKEPSWRRIGRRFVLDMATRSHPTYSVEIVGQGQNRNLAESCSETLLLTLYWVKLPQPMNEWWYSDKLRRTESLSSEPPQLSPLQQSAGVVSITEVTTRSTIAGGAEETKTDG